MESENRQSREPESADTGNGSAGTGIILTLAALPGDALIDRAALARMLGKCEASITRAWKRGELPKPVKFMGKPTWTARSLTDHFARRLAEAARERETLARKVHALRP